ncbi:MAG: DUF1572 family protein [Planctomycetes bacterium]|nr:DUF1572 family protein [Planctomycetota bacterium]
MQSESLIGELTRSIIAELRDAWKKAMHCVDQLDDEQLWSRPSAEMNSVANLLLHLNGNLRQWIVSGIGGSEDNRNRPLEFDERTPLARAELLEPLSETLKEVENAILAQTAVELVRIRRVQGFEVTGAEAIISSVSHLRGHSQEIVHMTRRLLGAEYRFEFVPQTPEQGAPQ